MSIAYMSLAWKSELPSGRKLVLLALCDNANDQGECFPSILTISKKCSMSERAVQQHIAGMEELGIIGRVMRAGRSTVYRIDPRRICTPAESAPPQSLHPTPADIAPLPPQNLHPTPADIAPLPPQNLHPTPAESAPITIKEPSIEPSLNQKKSGQAAFSPKAELLKVGVDEQTADDWLEHRKAKRAAVTRTVIAEHTKQAGLAGLTLAEALQTVCNRGWVGFEAAWLQPKQARAPQQQTYQTPSEKAKSWADRLTGRANNETRTIIDITPAEPLKLG